jgi:hypothetical protein
MSDGILVGGEPQALLAASSALHEVASRTDDVGRRLAAALASAATTAAAAAPFAPGRAAAVLEALGRVGAGPGAGLATVAAALEAVSLQLRGSGQALEAAGAVGLLASGGLGLLRGERPTVLASAEGVDLRREAIAGSWSAGPAGGGSTLGVREVRRPDGTSFFVVEATMSAKAAASAGIHVNGLGGFVEGAAGNEVTMRWAVATLRDAELVAAAASTALVPVAGGLAAAWLPKPTESVLAGIVAATAVGGLAMVPGTTSSGTAAVRTEVTSLASGGQRFAASVSGGGQLGLLNVAGTGGAGSARVSVDRSPTGAITRVSLSTTTEVDRGRHGNPLLESGNREATLVERQWDVELTPERRAAAERVATAVACHEAPQRADLDLLGCAAPPAAAEERTYDVRHQQSSVDASVGALGGGGAAGVDTATLRQP